MLDLQFRKGSVSGLLVTDLVEMVASVVPGLKLRGGPFSDRRWRTINSRMLGSVRSVESIDARTAVLAPGDDVALPSCVLSPQDGRFLRFAFYRAEVDALADRLVGRAGMEPGFIGAYLADWDDVQWQSEESLWAYEHAGRDHSSLPKRPDDADPDGRIDVSGNPGRRSWFNGIGLVAASRMWFGELALRYLDRDRLLEFAVAGTRRDAELIEVELFPFSWYQDRLDEVRARQRAFRDALRFDELEAQPWDLPSDPAFEIQDGQFEHGGVRRVLLWYGDDHRPTARSKATALCIRIFDSDNNRVLSEDDVPPERWPTVPERPPDAPLPD